MYKFCNKGKVVGTTGLQITRLTEDVKVWVYWNHSFDMHLSCGPVFFCFFPEFLQGSLAHPWEWLFLLMIVTSFVH